MPALVRVSGKSETNNHLNMVSFPWLFKVSLSVVYGTAADWFIAIKL